MNRQETIRILTILQTNYPQSFKGWGDDQAQAFIALWGEAFRSTPAAIVTAAVKSIIYEDDREFAPNIGQVNHKIREKNAESLVTEPEERWDEVVTFYKKYWPDEFRKHYSELPELTRRLISIDDLKSLANGTVNKEYEKNSFIKAYRELKLQQDMKHVASGDIEALQDSEANKQLASGTDMPAISSDQRRR